MNLPRILLIGAMALTGLLGSAHAGVEKLDDGTFLISGKWTFWVEKGMLSSTGKSDLGEFKAILFKSKVNEFPGIKEMKKTDATFQVKARVSKSAEGENILVVDEIMEKVQ